MNYAGLKIPDIAAVPGSCVSRGASHPDKSVHRCPYFMAHIARNSIFAITLPRACTAIVWAISSLFCKKSDVLLSCSSSLSLVTSLAKTMRR
jgi:hypothetical protein